MVYCIMQTFNNISIENEVILFISDIVWFVECSSFIAKLYISFFSIFLPILSEYFRGKKKYTWNAYW